MQGFAEHVLILHVRISNHEFDRRRLRMYLTEKYKQENKYQLLLSHQIISFRIDDIGC